MEENIKYCYVPFEREKSFIYDHVHIVWNEQVTFHQHVEWELSYVITGCGTRVLGDTAETFSCGEVILLPSNVPHCWSFDKYTHDKDGKIENITIIFPESLFKKCADVFPETRHSIAEMSQHTQAIKFEGYTLKLLQKTMTAMLTQSDMEQVSSLLNLFFIISSAHDEKSVVGVCNKSNRATKRMQDIYRFIVNNYQRNISLDEVTNYVGMNRSSFCTFFKRVKGQSFFSVLNEYRIESSCMMLRETVKPIADICYAVGFNYIPHYNRMFKKLKGETPNSYRGKYQKVK
jgi:AraC-type DNA-binding domain-containing proteins